MFGSVGLLCIGLAMLTCVESACDPNCATTCIQFPGCDGQCVAGYLFVQGVCKPCAAHCINCQIAGEGLCDPTRCISPYLYDSGSQLCKPCAPYCSGCTTNGPGKCDTGQCFAKYVLTGAQICLPCGDHCTACTVPYTCNAGACEAGYAIATGDVCLPCDPNCIVGCTLKGAFKCDPVEGASCKLGYGLHMTDFKCIVCAPHCLSGCAVEGPGFCDQCKPNCVNECEDGYGWGPAINDNTKHACYPCAEKCTSNCAVEGPGCCDPVGSGPGTCSYGTWTVKTPTPLCHYCI